MEIRVDIDPKTVNSRSQLGNLPALHLNCADGNVKAAQILLDKGAKLEERNFYDYTALGTAIETPRPEIVSLLLERGTDTGTTKGSICPLQQAVAKGHLAIFQSLLDNGVAPEPGGMIDDPVLNVAAVKGDEEAMKLFLCSLTSTDSSINLQGKMVTRFQKIMRMGGEAGLIQSFSTWPTGTMVNQFLGTVLCKAVARKDEACAKLLLARGADPDTINNNFFALEVAIGHISKGDMGQLKILDMLLCHGAVSNSRLMRYIERIDRIGAEMRIGWGVDNDMMNVMRLFAGTGADLNGEPLFRATEN